MTEREKMLEKIKALLSKTQENGCTESEALAALDKARALMDSYEVSESELTLTKAEKAILRKEPPGSRDPHRIKWLMGSAIGKFCDCKVWRGTDGLVYCGLRSDAQFASWLTDSLAAFVQAELANHLIGCLAPAAERKPIINGFVLGCTSRISNRLYELCKKSESVVSSNNRALVVVKSTAVADKMKELGITLRSGSRYSRQTDAGAFAAGRSAGDRASFGRPVSGAGATLRLTSN